MRDWIFSSVVSGLVPANNGFKRANVLLKELADVDHFKANAQVGRQPAAVVDRACRRVGAGHSDGDHILRAQRVFGDGRHQRRVNAAAQGHQGLVKAAFAHIIARAQHQRVVSGRGIVLIRHGHLRSIKGIDQHQVLLERGCLGNQLAVRIQGQRGAVEEQAVVAAHLVGHQHGYAVPPRNCRQHLAAHGALAVPVRRRRQIDVHRRMLAHQLFHGIDRIEPPRPEVLVVPGVLADGNRQPHAVQFHHLLRSRRSKVTLLVEDVVERQQALMLLQQQAAAIQQNGGIHGRLARLILQPEGPRPPARRSANRALLRPVHRRLNGSGPENLVFQGSRREDSRK